MLAVAWMAQRLSAEEGPVATRPSDVDVESLKPHWETGQRWAVETVTRRRQARRDVAVPASAPPIRWQFTVSGVEKVQARDCYRLDVRCQIPGPQPETALWIDQQSLVLRQITTQMPTPDGFCPMTVNYDFSSGQPAPVVGMLTALPVDMPLFLAGRSKGLATFGFRSSFGPPGQKAVDRLEFAHQVRQRITVLSTQEVSQLQQDPFAKSVLDHSYAKGLTSPPVTEIRLESHGRTVRQLWQAKRPWPIYCDNGHTVCRLVNSEAADHGQPTKEQRP
jgi:hypothetical protein